MFVSGFNLSQISGNVTNYKHMKKTIRRGYTQESYAPMPTKVNVFWRRFIPWQMIRFVVLNIKILKIVAGGHS